jgi:TatD DNase family protein
LDRVLTETDGPFTQIDGRPSTPSDVWVAVQGLARLHGTSPANIAATVTRNLKGLLVEQG